MAGSVSSSIANGQYTFTSPDDNVGLFYQSYKSGSSEPGKKIYIVLIIIILRAQ